MIKMHVFEAIEPPWFRFILYDNKSPVGEDAYFYMQAKKMGFKVFVDCSIPIGHLAVLNINEEAYWQYKFAQQWDWDRDKPKGKS